MKDADYSDSTEGALSVTGTECLKGKSLEDEHRKPKNKPCDLQHELQTPASATSIIIDEKDTVEVYFKTDDTSDDDLDAAELNVSAIVTVQPHNTVPVNGEDNITAEKQNDSNEKIEDSNTKNIETDTDLDFYPLSLDKHRNCCYRCWYSERCNACIIGLIDRIPETCLCPCLLSCYRCLQVVLCCDWSTDSQ